MKHLVCLLVAFIFIAAMKLYSQPNSTEENSFAIYVFKRRYDQVGKQFIDSRDFIKEIQLLGGAHIDPRKKGMINLRTVKNRIVSVYPNFDDMGVLCINLENQLYHNLKKEKKGSQLYHEAIYEFQRLIYKIRQLRPNVKIGVYGLPFRTYYPRQKKWNAEEKLDPILSIVDYLFPSMYILFPDKQRGKKANDAYWEMNLDQAFSYGDLLGKPVVPFIWYIVSPGNSKYGRELIEKKEMRRYLNYIRNYTSSNNCKVDGLVWWEQPRKEDFEKMKNEKFKYNEKSEQGDILKNYIDYNFEK